MYRFDSRSRTVALANLEAAFGSELDPGWREQIARRSIQVFARSFLELFWTRRLTAQNVEQFISFEDPRRFQEMLDSEIPVIGITPHFGNFEWGSALFAFRGYAGIILTQRFKNDRLTVFFRRLREISGQTAVTQENSMLRLFRALRRGVPVGILTDLTLKLRDPAVIINAFGMKKRVTLLHGMLHEGTRSPILPFITLPQRTAVIKCGSYPNSFSPRALLTTKSPRSVGTNLNRSFAKTRNIGFGCTNTGDTDRSRQNATTRCMRINPPSSKARSRHRSRRKSRPENLTGQGAHRETFRNHRLPIGNQCQKKGSVIFVSMERTSSQCEADLSFDT